MSAAGPAFLYVAWPTTLWTQNEAGVARTTVTFLMPASYDAWSFASVSPE